MPSKACLKQRYSSIADLLPLATYWQTKCSLLLQGTSVDGQVQHGLVFPTGEPHAWDTCGVGNPVVRLATMLCLQASCICSVLSKCVHQSERMHPAKALRSMASHIVAFTT